MPDVVKEFSGEYAFLSNFHKTPVSVSIGPKMYDFPSSEHAFQALKVESMVAVDPKVRAKYIKTIQDAPTPSKSKMHGKIVKIDAAHWDKRKDNVMRKVVFAKFLQDSTLCARLLETGTAMLVEGNTHGDTYWGRVDGKGLNRLGSILMEVRGYWWFAGVTDTYPMKEQHAYILMGW